MLTYLINVTGDLLTISLIVGVLLAFADYFCTDKGRMIVRIGLGLGVVSAAVRTYITNTRRLVGGWRVGAYGYALSLALFVLLMAAFVIGGRLFFGQAANLRRKMIADSIISALTGLLGASYLYGALPNVFIYPFKFDTGGNGFLSTDYLFRLGGYVLGVIICLIALTAAYKIAALTAGKGFAKLLAASFLALNIMYAVYDFARLMLVLTPRKIVDSVALFNFAAASNNHSHWYAYMAFLVMIALSIHLWIQSYVMKEPYSNNAERRKLRAMWRSGKRYSVVIMLCFICAILCSTWFVALNTVVIREAPVEDPEIVKNENGDEMELWVSLDAVSDGHLHRFGYTTPDGNPVRFIVVLKQENTNNYGVGLDACEICGEAGYYENNEGRIVCKKCGVVMNTTTIGMKGGCNPIIIDYDISEGYIIVPVSEMVKNQSRFKK